jgi:hypothetical protein
MDAVVPQINWEIADSENYKHILREYVLQFLRFNEGISRCHEVAVGNRDDWSSTLTMLGELRDEGLVIEHDPHPDGQGGKGWEICQEQQ